MELQKMVLVSLRSGLTETIRCPEGVYLVIIDNDTQENSLPKVCYQPEYNEKEWERINFLTSMVYRNMESVRAHFPGHKIVEHKTEEIQDPIFID